MLCSAVWRTCCLTLCSCTMMEPLGLGEGAGRAWPGWVSRTMWPAPPASSFAGGAEGSAEAAYPAGASKIVWPASALLVFTRISNGLRETGTTKLGFNRLLADLARHRSQRSGSRE